MKAKTSPKRKRAPRVDPREPASEATSHRPFAGLGAKAGRKAPARPPPQPQPAPATRELTFAEEMRDVRPLAGRARRAERPVAVAETRPMAVETRFEVVDDGAAIEGRRLDVDPREVGRLRRGQYAVDGSLDLHGKTLLDAKASVVEFLARRRRQGDRAVMIVHGKGLHSPRGHAVLRGELGAWLSQGSAGKHVLAFVSRVDAARGEGDRSAAILVLLDRAQGLL